MTSSKAWEKISFINSRNQLLVGLLHTPGSKTGPVVIACHGFTGSKEGGGMALAMGEELGSLGYNVLLYDFSGNGESEGLFENLTLTGQINDLNSAVNWCVNEGMSPVYTVGRSFGGTTAICQAAEDKRIAGVCSWAAPARLLELFLEIAESPSEDEERYTLVGEDGIAYLKSDFFEDLKKYDVPLLASRIAPRPLLIIHGEEDDVVPPEDANMIFNEARNPKKLLYIPGADHQFSGHNREVWEAMFRWLENIKFGKK